MSRPELGQKWFVNTRQWTLLEYQRIDIKSLAFGRKNAVYCNTHNDWTTGCQHKRACTIPADIQLLGDPCIYVQKYLEVEYECLAGGLRSRFVCDNEQLVLSCPSNQKIVINDVTYGRTNPVKCYRPGTISNTNLCSAAGAKDIVVKNCDYKTSCNVVASTSLFGDPCPENSKYLEVIYSCH